MFLFGAICGLIAWSYVFQKCLCTFECLGANPSQMLPWHSLRDANNCYSLCYSWDNLHRSLSILFRIKHYRPLISHSPIPNFIIFPHLSFSLETVGLGIGKHTFNYPWPHISLKYLHCTTPQGETVHDLYPNLFMGCLLGKDVLPRWLQYVYILFLNHGRVYLWCLQPDRVVRLRTFPIKTLLAYVA